MIKTIKLFTPYKKQKEVIDSLEDPNVFFTIVCAGRQVGKSLLGMNIALRWAIDNSNRIIYWVSPTFEQQQKVYKQIINACHHTGCIKSNKAGGGTEIIFTNNSKILFRSAAQENSLRGESVDYMILDEGAFIKRDTIQTILLPMLSSRGKKMLVISTPKGKNWFYDWFLKGSIEDKYKSFRFTTYDSPYANQDLISVFKNDLPPKLFKQEIEAEFVDSSSVFNNLSDVLCLEEQEPKDGDKYYGGIDIGLINDSSVLSILNSEGNLIKYYRWDKLETPELIEEIVKINEKWKFKKILIENNNQGLPIFQDMRRRIGCLEQFNTNSKSKPELINRLIHLFNMREIKLINDELLRIELEAFIFKQNDNGVVKFLADYGFHDDIIMSLAIARSCYDKYKFTADYLRFY